MSITHAQATAVVRAAAWNADHVITSVVLAAMTPGGTTGIYAGASTLVRIFQAAAGAGGQSAGLNVFVGGAGNSTMTNGAGGTYLASYNMGLGNGSLHNLTNGWANAAIGMSALQLSTTGYLDTAVGYYALYGNTTGINLVGIGANAGWYQADGVTALASASRSVYVGSDVRGFSNADDNTIVIGYAAIGAGANKAVIGNASLTDVYLGSSAGLAILHAATLTLTAGAVTYGADNSGGAGYRTMLVPNA